MGFRDRVITLFKRTSLYDTIATDIRKSVEKDLYVELPGIPRETMFRLDGVQPSRMYYNPLLLYSLYVQSSDLNSIVFKHAQKVLRQGFELQPVFKSQCPSCGWETADVEKEKCPECGVKTVGPSETEYRQLMDFREKANRNIESLHYLLLEFITSLDLYDESFLILAKDYILNDAGDIVFQRVADVYASSALFMRRVADEYWRSGGKWTCLRHRKIALDAPGRCPECGLPLHEAYYAAVESPMAFDKGAEVYYLESEVIAASFYSPSRLGGMSPLIPLYDVIITLIMMSRFVGSTYRFGRAPRGVIWARTPNVPDFNETWNKVLSRLQTDALYQPAIAFPTGFGGGREEGASLNYLQLSPKIAEMDFTNVRNEFRRSLAAFYGLSNLSINDLAQSSGLNSETEQLTNEDEQLSPMVRMLNEAVLKQLCRKMGIATWYIEVNPVSKKDEMRETDIKMREAQLAQQMAMMGIDVAYNDKGEFEYKAGKVQPQSGGGMFGGGVPKGGEGEEEFNLSEDTIDHILGGIQKMEEKKAL